MRDKHCDFVCITFVSVVVVVVVVFIVVAVVANALVVVVLLLSLLLLYCFTRKTDLIILNPFNINLLYIKETETEHEEKGEEERGFCS